jgi:hypothetical protein
MKRQHNTHDHRSDAWKPEEQTKAELHDGQINIHKEKESQ